MQSRYRVLPGLLRTIALPVLLVAAFATAQPRPASPAAPARPASPAIAANVPVPSEKDDAETQTKLIKLLRLSPTLTTVVSHDPSLLSNQDYVARNNPQLAEFLTAILRSRAIRTFTSSPHVLRKTAAPTRRSNAPSGRSSCKPQRFLVRQRRARADRLPAGLRLLPVAVVWLIRQFLENRRWGRIFKLQSEVHGRLIDKFSSNQELAGYMETEAGKRFLEAAPIPVASNRSSACPTPLPASSPRCRSAVVLVLLGVGFFLLRHVRLEMHDPDAGAGNRRPHARPGVYHLRRDHLGAGRASRPHAGEPHSSRRSRALRLTERQ